MKPGAPAAIEATIGKLRNAQVECAKMIEELAYFDTHKPESPLPVLSGFYPYPHDQIDFFQKRAADAHNLKKSVCALLAQLGPRAAELKSAMQSIVAIEPYEEWCANMKKARRPCRSGLESALEIIETACAAPPKQKRNRGLGSIKIGTAVKTYLSACDDTPQKFANHAGFDEKTIRKFLDGGNVDKKTFDVISKAMGITTEQLQNCDLPEPKKRKPRVRF